MVLAVVEHVVAFQSAATPGLVLVDATQTAVRTLVVAARTVSLGTPHAFVAHEGTSCVVGEGQWVGMATAAFCWLLP